MLYYLIICRSLTHAQRLAGVLERGGITTHIQRTPKSVAGEGCSHSVRIAQRHLPAAMALLKKADLTPERVFTTAGDGSYQEVAL